jgi:hypothetical protein
VGEGLRRAMRATCSPEEAAILSFLRGREWTGPTDIARAVGPPGSHSAWASPRCIRLVRKGLLERGGPRAGHYRLRGFEGGADK